MPHRRVNAKDDPMIGRTFANRYRIRDRLGSGGMAIVYASYDSALMREVAIKILRPDALDDPTAGKRLQREATAAGQLHHPHIITFHDVGMAGEHLFIVMELLRGMTIADARTKAGGRMPVLRVAEIGAQICAALQCVHDANIVHRDLKPENVFLLERDKGDYAKLLDFSIAKLPEELVDSRLTQTGTVFGTPFYMAPEQAQGDPVSFQTDIYSLGSMMFEMVAGRPPFQASNAIKLLTKQSMETAPTLKALGVNVPRPFGDLIASMLERAAWRRPATATDVQATLRKIVQAGTNDPKQSPAKARAKAKCKLAGTADTTMQGQFSDAGVGVPVRSSTAADHRLSDTAELAKPRPPTTQRKKQQANAPPPTRRKRRSTQPRAASSDRPNSHKPAAASPEKSKSQTKTSRPVAASGRRKRATMPRWTTSQQHAVKEGKTSDEDDTL